MTETLLDVRDLSVSVLSPAGPLQILNGVSFEVPRRGSVAIVGESGSGKTMTALAILSLLPEGATLQGRVTFDGRDLGKLSEKELCSVRGGSIGMVFQEPATALDPVYTIGWQIIEALRLHRDVSRKEARALALEQLRKVGMPGPEERLDSYPHELSGGMRQRALIAMATVTQPKLLLLDEPTTALDRTVEAQVLELLSRLREETDTSLLLISHDLAVVAEVADDIVVLYAGQVVERGPARLVLDEPHHPYTRGLIATIPEPSRRPRRQRGARTARLPVLPGAPPDLASLPRGCRFAPRCEHHTTACDEPIELRRVGDRLVRCVLDGPSEPAAPSEPAPAIEASE